MDSFKVIQQMKSSTLRNYVLPGLDSSLLGNGIVRIFESSRDTEEHITPHSHRFDFACFVMRGWVENTVYTLANEGKDADCFVMATLKYLGSTGKYEVDQGTDPLIFDRNTDTYVKGQWYSMSSEEIHSIKFSRDAVVLFFEGPNVTSETSILEPCSHGKRVPTFKVHDWMFEKAEP